MTLRAEVVEAMAQAIGSSFVEKMGWGESKPFAALEVYGIARHQAEAALDAALDVLGEFVEAGDVGAKNAGLSPLVAHGLLAVLRAGKGSDDA